MVDVGDSTRLRWQEFQIGIQSRHSARTLRAHRSAFARGARTGVFMTSSAAKTASKLPAGASEGSGPSGRVRPLGIPIRGGCLALQGEGVPLCRLPEGAKSAITYDHYTVLRIIEDGSGLPGLGEASWPRTRTMTDLLTGS
jgi:hypothetical protein